MYLPWHALEGIMKLIHCTW